MNESKNTRDNTNGGPIRHARWIALASLLAMTVLTVGCYFPEDWRRDRRHRDRDRDHDHHSQVGQQLEIRTTHNVIQP